MMEKREGLKQKVLQHPFKRGAMGFEDYNYSLYNPYILVENKDKEVLQVHDKK